MLEKKKKAPRRSLFSCPLPPPRAPPNRIRQPLLGVRRYRDNVSETDTHRCVYTYITHNIITHLYLLYYYIILYYEIMTPVRRTCRRSTRTDEENNWKICAFRPSVGRATAEKHNILDDNTVDDFLRPSRESQRRTQTAISTYNIIVFRIGQIEIRENRAESVF